VFPGHPTRAEVDLAAVAHNVAGLAALVAPAAVCVVVKADGYGHGAVEVARAALGAGATWLAVAHPVEARTLREADIDAPVLLLSEPRPGAMAEVVADRVRVTISSEAGATALAEAAAAAGTTAPVHLKVDTGMHRSGCAPEAAPGLARRIADDPALVLEAVWTHYAVADREDDPFTRQQGEVLDEVLARLTTDSITPSLVHQANSAAALGHPASRRDLVRCGLATYGVAPAPGLASVVDLHPALRLVSEVVSLRTAGAGEASSYGLLRPFTRDTTLATVPIGYADGVARALWEHGEVLVRGRRCPFAGVVTMDQVVIDVTDLGDDVAVGDRVVLLGDDGHERITADEVAEHAGTISYEVLSRIGARVPRVHGAVRAPAEGEDA